MGTTSLHKPSNNNAIKRSDTPWIDASNGRQRARSHHHSKHKQPSHNDTNSNAREYKRRRSVHHTKASSKSAKRHPRRHSNDLNERKHRKVKKTKKGLISFKKQPKTIDI